MSEGLWGLIGVAVGGVLTFVMTQFASWQSGREENRKIRNRVLYFLFEIHHQFAKLSRELPDMGVIFAGYLEVREELAAAKDEITPEMFNRITSAAKSGLYGTTLRDFARIAERYPNVIQDLAAIDPVSAYRIHSLADIMQSVEHYHNLYLNQLEQESDEQMPAEVRAILRDAITPNAALGLMEVIEEVVNKLTKGPFRQEIQREALKLIAKNREFDQEEFKEVIYDSYDVIFTKLGVLQEASSVVEPEMDWTALAKELELAMGSSTNEEE